MNGSGQAHPDPAGLTVQGVIRWNELFLAILDLRDSRASGTLTITVREFSERVRFQNGKVVGIEPTPGGGDIESVARRLRALMGLRQGEFQFEPGPQHTGVPGFDPSAVLLSWFDSKKAEAEQAAHLGAHWDTPLQVGARMSSLHSRFVETFGSKQVLEAAEQGSTINELMARGEDALLLLQQVFAAYTTGMIVLGKSGGDVTAGAAAGKPGTGAAPPPTVDDPDPWIGLSTYPGRVDDLQNRPAATEPHHDEAEAVADDGSADSELTISEAPGQPVIAGIELPSKIPTRRDQQQETLGSGPEKGRGAASSAPPAMAEPTTPGEHTPVLVVSGTATPVLVSMPSGLAAFMPGHEPKTDRGAPLGPARAPAGSQPSPVPRSSAAPAAAGAAAAGAPAAAGPLGLPPATGEPSPFFRPPSATPSPAGAAGLGLTPPTRAGGAFSSAGRSGERQPPARPPASAAPQTKPQRGAGEGGGSAASVEEKRARSVAEVREWIAAVEAGVKDGSHYAVLQLPEDTTDKQIQDQRTAWIRAFHPDLFRRVNLGELAARLDSAWKAVNMAASVLLDRQKRKEHDVFLERRRQGLPTDVNVILEAERIFKDGDRLLKGHRYEEALERLNKAVQINKAEPEFQICRAWAEYMLAKSQNNLASGLRERVKEQLRAALANQAKLDRGHYYLGLVLKDEGRESEALSCFQQAVVQNPYNVDAKREIRNLSERKQGGGNAGLFGRRK